MTTAPGDARKDGTRFGLTIVSVAAGELVDQPVEALIVPGNGRGLLGAGPAGSLRSAAGAGPEREALASAPHEVGTAFATSPGDLAARGVAVLLHAVVSDGLGEPARPTAVPTAVADALRLARAGRHRSVALPILGVSVGAPVEGRIEAAGILVETLVASLRLGGGRLERAILVSRFDDDLDQLAALVARARERLWTGAV